MDLTIQVRERGVVTLPAELREKYNIENGNIFRLVDLDGVFVFVPMVPMVPELAREIERARQVPGVDLILMGHTHREVPALVVNGVLLAQADKWADRVVRAEIYCERNAAGRWQVVAKASRTIPVTEKIAADPEIVRLAEPYDRETQAWLAQPIGECARELTAADSRLRDNALLDLIAWIQNNPPSQ